jgi:HlyD family secretion protein
MSKKLKWIIGILIILVIVLVGLKKTGMFGEDEGIRVSSEKVQKRTIVETVSASGKVYPEVEVKISPDISGEIVDLYVQEGDSVKKGTVLARIYGDTYTTQRDEAAANVNIQQASAANATAALESLKAQLDQARKTYDMQKELYDDKVISRSEFNTAEAAMRSAQANYNAALQNIRGMKASVQGARAGLQKAYKDLSRTTVVSPIDGIVSLLNVKRGERVVGSSMMAGTEMMRVADLNTIEVRVDVSENDIPKVKIGDSADIEIEAYLNRKFKGVVTQIASSNTGAAMSTGGTSDVTNYKVNIRLLPDSYRDLINPSSTRNFPFRPGMSATADIKTKTHKDVLAVPINAVTTRYKSGGSPRSKEDKDDDQTTQTTNTDDLEVVVFLINADKKVKRVPVRTDIQDINYIEVLSGLKAGDEVVTLPFDIVNKTLKDGDLVNVVPKEKLFEKD